MRIEDVVEYCRRHPEVDLTFYTADGGVERSTYGELGARAGALADRLTEAGLKAGHVVGLQAETHPDWIVWDVALSSLKVVIRAYPSHHEFDAGERVAGHGLALLVSDRPQHAGAPFVAPLSPEAFEAAMVKADAPRGDRQDLHSIVYSSGTTGREKVLMISRTGAAAALDWFIEKLNADASHRQVVFLPLANYQQRQQIYAGLKCGMSLVLCGYTQAMRAIRQEGPTFLLAPPALYENMLSITLSGGPPLPNLFGGQIRFMITGMAPIRPKVMKAYWDAGLMLLEGYGLTECGIIACNTPDRYRPGTVGPLVDPGAFSLSDEGEILIRQRHPLSLGYIDADDLNASVFKPDGTVMTGDVGRLDDEGFLILEGRVKDMIPLPSGKKLHPGDVELMLLQLPGVEDAIAVDNGAGVTAVLNVSADTTEPAIRAALRRMSGPVDAAGAVNQIIFTDIPLSRNPIFSTANMKLNRRLVGRHFLGADA